MSSYLLRRFAISLILLWGVLTLTFVLLHVAPGDPVDVMLDPSLPEQDASTLRARFGLDRPLHEQYMSWFVALARGDLGVSLSQQRPVAAILRDAIPVTLRLSTLGLLCQYLFGIALGVLAATRRSSWFERPTTVLSLVLYSLPLFWLGLMSQLLFSYQLGWLPSGGMATATVARDGWLAAVADQLRHMLLPVLLLGISGAAGVARVLRASLLEVLDQDYIRTARAKGLASSSVVFRHGLRNACIPLISLLGLSLPFLLGGSVVTEIVFGWPGMGRVTVDAMSARDIPVVLATTLCAGTLVVVGSFLADLLYAWADPRIRDGGAA